MATLRQFLEEHLDKQQPGSLYISGPPGTGKTATVTQLLEGSSKVSGVYILCTCSQWVWSLLQSSWSPVVVNCMSVSHPHAIYGKIYHQLMGGCGRKDIPAHALERAIVKHLTTSKKMM